MNVIVTRTYVWIYDFRSQKINKYCRRCRHAGASWTVPENIWWLVKPFKIELNFTAITPFTATFANRRPILGDEGLKKGNLGS